VLGEWKPRETRKADERESNIRRQLGALKSHPRCCFRRSSIKNDIKTLKLSIIEKFEKEHLMNCRLAVQLFGVALRGPEQGSELAFAIFLDKLRKRFMTDRKYLACPGANPLRSSGIKP
jgi:hypothetical protein